MKKSLYNNELRLSSDYHLIYNTYTNAFLVIGDSLYKEYQSLNALDISKAHPFFYSQLLQAGCFVEDEEDEIEKLKKRIAEIDNQSEQYMLTINPTMNCNFSCWYCYENHIAKSKMPPEILEHVKQHITKISSNKELKKFNMCFFGGERKQSFWAVLPA